MIKLKTIQRALGLFGVAAIMAAFLALTPNPTTPSVGACPGLVLQQTQTVNDSVYDSHTGHAATITFTTKLYADTICHQVQEYVKVGINNFDNYQTQIRIAYHLHANGCIPGVDTLDYFVVTGWYYYQFWTPVLNYCNSGPTAYADAWNSYSSGVRTWMYSPYFAPQNNYGDEHIHETF